MSEHRITSSTGPAGEAAPVLAALAAPTEDLREDDLRAVRQLQEAFTCVAIQLDGHRHGNNAISV